MARPRRVKRRKKTSTGRIYVAVIMLFMICVMTVQMVRLYDKNQDLKKQEESLQSQVDEANEKSEQLKEYEEYVGTDEYIESEASQKLGLTHDNWIIFKEKED
ncbi:septum formation initiator family protein [Pseudobutyrivibrio ruminis]|uniref:Septum formation initiator n=1 Tax=Pseudobutyrivibrio ruminis DSM 9787 TaxID=1123011 RepID=A0A285RZW7_9FIRM|nr:septum formation initiator family protein [Pseudobutyrivibrio ruminis]SOB98331.1 Septum formation initiator [Pseudobutyrivibrio ruminis DSM 9787]